MKVCYSDETKMVAVGEALLGMETLTSIARRYGMSVGYLSILTSRARKAVIASKGNNYTERKVRKNIAIRDLYSRISNIEVKIDRIFK